MATLVLTAAGGIFGPLGAAVGALAGRAIDAQIFGSDPREGPRLKELTVTGSSYGTPIARHYGAMRASGTIIWSTDFRESSATEGGGKGRPETTSYSYSVSFAVALSSRPIDRIGRIWADGNLLRGAGGDLKTGGSLRLHTGTADQERDPLLEAALGARCPAHRSMAYAVFEDLDLTDFGNRIPALSFEIFAGDGSNTIPALLGEERDSAGEGARFAELSGFSHEGGTLRDVVRLVDRLHPLFPVVEAEGLRFTGPAVAAEPILLPEAARWEDGDFGAQSGQRFSRDDARGQAMSALRYYDVARDYQPGVQHATGCGGEATMLEFPGALRAADALALAARANERAAIRRDALSYRVAELDPRVAPGAIVRTPGQPGLWRVAGWEWREKGVELELLRHRAPAGRPAVADPGDHWTPPDRVGAQTVLRVFELPWDGLGSPGERKAFAAVGARQGRWAGARLYAAQAGMLSDTGRFAAERALTGRLAEPLSASPGLRLEAGAALVVELDDPEAVFEASDAAGLAQWSNRLLVGGEILQFASAASLGGGRWRLGGLLRGRGGTEAAAAQAHPEGTALTALDHRLVQLDAGMLTRATEGFAAIGRSDDAPVTATLEGAGASQLPPSPVHGRLAQAADGSLALGWTRRARGGWAWLDRIEQPLVEESEAYDIGLGPVALPLARWTSPTPGLVLPASTLRDFPPSHAGQPLWVRQRGTYGFSAPLLLGVLPETDPSRGDPP